MIFFTYDGCEVRDKLLKTMKMIFEKKEVLNDFKKSLSKSFYEKGDKTEIGNYRGISLVSVGSWLLSVMILLSDLEIM